MTTEAQFECDVCQMRVIADVDQFICEACAPRVQAARIIDPSTWATMDAYRAAARSGRFVDRDSIAKADAILALLTDGAPTRHAETPASAPTPLPALDTKP